ncbi:hypothetical protein LJC45_02200 [Alistipes sp. OttesenSCG-928-B03]|nr:hypothetical protein [Alistipes sp. OttesenSCG-928-B03]
MKTFILLSVACCLLAPLKGNSQEAHNGDKDPVNTSFSELRPEEQARIDALKIFADDLLAATRPEDYATDWTMAALKNLDDYELRTMPHYVLDEDKFLELPTADNIAKCFCKDKDRTMFYARNAEGHNFVMTIAQYPPHPKHRKTYWSPVRATNDFDKLTSWLPGVLAKSDSEAYKVFTFYAHKMIVVSQNGKSVFYDMDGTLVDIDAFAGYAVEKIANMRNHDPSQRVYM